MIITNLKHKKGLKKGFLLLQMETSLWLDWMWRTLQHTALPQGEGRWWGQKAASWWCSQQRQAMGIRKKRSQNFRLKQILETGRKVLISPNLCFPLCSSPLLDWPCWGQQLIFYRIVHMHYQLPTAQNSPNISVPSSQTRTWRYMFRILSEVI